MVGLVFILVAAAAIITTAALWISGIDYMKENHPDYKGEDLIDDDLEDWDVTVSDGLEKEKKHDTKK